MKWWKKIFNKKQPEKEKICLLLQETETQRIVQRRHMLFERRIIIAREILVEDKWTVVTFLYSNQMKTVEDYKKYFDWDLKTPTIGFEKQFEC